MSYISYRTGERSTTQTQRKGPAYFTLLRGNIRFTVYARCKTFRLRSVERKGHDAIGEHAWYHVPRKQWPRLVMLLALRQIKERGERFEFPCQEQKSSNAAASTPTKTNGTVAVSESITTATPPSDRTGGVPSVLPSGRPTVCNAGVGD